MKNKMIKVVLLVFSSLSLSLSSAAAAAAAEVRTYDIRGDDSTLKPAYREGVTALNETITAFAHKYSADVIINGTPTKKAVALTFDDGPGGVTTEILDILKTHGVKATFFLRGEYFGGSESNPLTPEERALRKEEVKRIKAEEHAVLSHTWHHLHLPTVTNKEVIRREIQSAHDALEAILGEKLPRFMRLSFGEIDEAVYAVLKELNLKPIMWSLESFDWASSRTAAEIEAMITPALRNGEIILMHAMDNRSKEKKEAGPAPTVAALPGVIKAIKALGFEFARIDETDFLGA